jgi:hypothetical protein
MGTRAWKPPALASLSNNNNNRAALIALAECKSSGNRWTVADISQTLLRGFRAESRAHSLMHSCKPRKQSPMFIPSPLLLWNVTIWLSVIHAAALLLEKLPTSRPAWVATTAEPADP